MGQRSGAGWRVQLVVIIGISVVARGHGRDHHWNGRQAVKESINTMKSTQNFKVFMWCVCGVGGMFVARACARVCVFDFSVVCV